MRIFPLRRQNLLVVQPKPRFASIPLALRRRQIRLGRADFVRLRPKPDFLCFRRPNVCIGINRRIRLRIFEKRGNGAEFSRAPNVAQVNRRAAGIARADCLSVKFVFAFEFFFRRERRVELAAVRERLGDTPKHVRLRHPRHFCSEFLFHRKHAALKIFQFFQLLAFERNHRSRAVKIFVAPAVPRAFGKREN